MYGREELLASLPSQKVRPATDELPTQASYQLSRWERGTLNFEAIAGQMAAIEYLGYLGTTFGDAKPDDSRRSRLVAGYKALGAHERFLGDRFLDGVAAMPEVNIYGLAKEGR